MLAMRHRRSLPAAALAGLAVAAAALAAPVQAPKKPSAAELDALVARYFKAAEEERVTLRATLEQVDPLTADQAKTWAKKLLKVAATAGPKIGDKARNYFYDEKKKKGLYLLGKLPGNGGLFFGLHGGGAGSGDADSAQAPWQGAVATKGWAAVFPEVLEKTEAAWGDEPTEKFVLELIEAMKRSTKIDTNRIYLGGHSMGGYGTWTLGGRHADLFAGLTAFAGAATPYRDPADRKTPIAIQEGILPNLRNVPIWCYHSKDDPRVDFPVNVLAVGELKKLSAKHGGYVHHFDAVDGKGHDFPDPTPPLDWVAKHPRDPRPKKIVWQPFRSWKRMFYWIWWQNPQINATLIADITAPNQFDLAFEEASAPPSDLWLLLDERIVDFNKEVVVRVGGNEKFRGKVTRSLAAMVQTAAERNDAEMLFTARLKVPL